MSDSSAQLPEIPGGLELMAAEVNLSNRFPQLVFDNAQRFGQKIQDNPELVAFAYSMYLAGIIVVGTLQTEVKNAVSEAAELTKQRFGKH